MVGAYYVVRKYEKSTKGSFFSAIIIVNLFYLIFRSLLGLAKSKGGEIENVMNLVGLNFYVAAVLFLILAFIIFFLWNRKFNKKYLGAMLDITCSFSFLVVIMVMEGIDTKFFWDRYPTIEIEHVGIHNPHD